MPLPKISTPSYELVIPSTGKKIKYRPFLVKEEKVHEKGKKIKKRQKKSTQRSKK